MNRIITDEELDAAEALNRANPCKRVYHTQYGGFCAVGALAEVTGQGEDRVAARLNHQSEIFQANDAGDLDEAWRLLREDVKVLNARAGLE